MYSIISNCCAAVEDIVAGPRKHLDGKWTTNGRRIDAEFNGITLHGTTQTRCIVVSKATDNVVQSSTKSLVIASVPHDSVVQDSEDFETIVASFSFFKSWNPPSLSLPPVKQNPTIQIPEEMICCGCPTTSSPPKSSPILASKITP